MRSQQLPATTAWKTALGSGSTATPHGSCAISWAITAPETRVRSNTSASGSMIASQRIAVQLTHSNKDELIGYQSARSAHWYASTARLSSVAPTKGPTMARINVLDPA